ncbi:hypothetical protein ES705_15959 [subsurface metagenome]
MKNLKTEAEKYEQLRKLGQELHIPMPEHFFEFEVRDKSGKVIQTLKQRSHSWVRNAYNLLLSTMASKDIDDAGVFGAGLLSIKLTTGAIIGGAFGTNVAGQSTFETVSFGYGGGAGAATQGILVGSDDTAESFEDYVLLGPIAEGAGAGQLNHVAMDAPTKSYDEPTKTWTITRIRYFNNNSAGVVNVNEVCQVTRGYIDGGYELYIVSRDKLGATVIVPATGQLKVTYVINLTYPS